MDDASRGLPNICRLRRLWLAIANPVAIEAIRTARHRQATAERHCRDFIAMRIMTCGAGELIEGNVERFDLRAAYHIRYTRHRLHDPHLVAVTVHADDTHDGLALDRLLRRSRQFGLRHS